MLQDCKGLLGLLGRKVLLVQTERPAQPGRRGRKERLAQLDHRGRAGRQVLRAQLAQPVRKGLQGRSEARDRRAILGSTARGSTGAATGTRLPLMRSAILLAETVQVMSRLFLLPGSIRQPMADHTGNWSRKPAPRDLRAQPDLPAQLAQLDHRGRKVHKGLSAQPDHKARLEIRGRRDRLARPEIKAHRDRLAQLAKDTIGAAIGRT